MKHLPRSSRFMRLMASGAAFSLAETTMAVAIAALGIVSIMGLMPQGLETSRKTGNMAAETRIMQEIVGDLESLDWSLLDAQNSTTRKYDDQGMRIPDTGGGTQLVSYVAQINVNSANVPGSSAGASGDVYLRRLTVKIATTANPGYSFPVSDIARYRTVSHLLAKIQ